MRNICFTMAYNLTSQVRKITKLLYEQNKSDFKHIIFDLGFPLTEDAKPDNIQEAKKKNTTELKKICLDYGSEYMQLENIGISQNWTNIYKIINPSHDDVMIGVDPDEIPQHSGWVKAMGNALRGNRIAMASLMITDHIQYAHGWAADKVDINGVKCYLMHGVINYALIGFTGEFLKVANGIPVPDIANRYGYLEYALHPLFDKYKFDWVVLEDFHVEHTYPCQVYHGWKNYVLQQGNNQITFDEYLML